MAPILTSLASIIKQYGITALASGGDAASPGGITATGGVISDYEDSGTYYRAHVFTATGEFDVTALATDASTPNNIAILAVGGGGGGGQHNAAGGGAGGLQYSASVPVSVAPYTITVGAGGAGNNLKPGGSGPYLGGGNGGTTTAGPLITAAQGGGGGSGNNPSPAGQPGGSGSGVS